MNPSIPLRALAVALLLPALALAQETGASTQGPEGSEYGKGGYVSAGGGRNFSLELAWGASFQDQAPLGGTLGVPLFAGLTASFWASDWFLLDLSTAYLANNGRFQVLVGPRFRTPIYPVSFSAGLQAGPIIAPAVGLRFGLSPNVRGDLILGDRFLLGLGYALDLALGGDGTAHRLFMTLGYRF